MTAAPGTIFTFYSYKGGVGRSMAVANIGVLLARRGAKVLLVDFDLEAPGLEVFFESTDLMEEGVSVRAGILDLLEARSRDEVVDWNECLLSIGSFGLKLLPAGKRTSEYSRRVQSLNWPELFVRHQIGNYFNDLRGAWRTVFDFVLVDSRTGITDMGDICTVVLPDVLVLLFVSNKQNLDGICDVFRRAARAHSMLPVNRGALVAVPIPARDEVYNEYDRSLEWRGRYQKQLKFMYDSWLPRGITPEDALSKLFIPYVANWSFGERLPVHENPAEIKNPASISAAYDRIATLLESRLDFESLSGAGLSHELVIARQAEATARIKSLELAERSSRLFWVAMFATVMAIGAMLFSLFGRDIVHRAVAFSSASSPSIAQPPPRSTSSVGASLASGSPVVIAPRKISLGPLSSLCDEKCCYGSGCAIRQSNAAVCPSGRECVPCSMGDLRQATWKLRVQMDPRNLQRTRGISELEVCVEFLGGNRCLSATELGRDAERSPFGQGAFNITVGQLGLLAVQLQSDGVPFSRYEAPSGIRFGEKLLCTGVRARTVDGSGEPAGDVSIFFDDDTYIVLSDGPGDKVFSDVAQQFAFEGITPEVFATSDMNHFRAVVGPLSPVAAAQLLAQAARQDRVLATCSSSDFVGGPMPTTK